MAYDPDAFRARYRASMNPRYSAALHGGFVVAVALAAFTFFVSRLDGVRPLEWLAAPLGALVFNWGEFTVHRTFGHRRHPLGRLFYQRHTGDHHSFFTHRRMAYDEARDFRVILFPAWLVVLFTGLLAAPAYLWLGLWNENVGAIVAATLVGFYLVYEFLHTTQHLPDEHPLSRLPWVRTMRRHHRLHHARGRMTSANFNLTFPFMDWLHGTLVWGADAADADADPDDEAEPASTPLASEGRMH